MLMKLENIVKSLETYRETANIASAVLVPLIEEDGEWKLVFEVRAAEVTQPGQVCFPGGRIEAGETALECLYRECEEELLLNKDNIEIKDVFGTFSGSNRRMIRVYWGVLHDYHGTFSPAETKAIMILPLTYFLEHEPQEDRTLIYLEPHDENLFNMAPGGEEFRQGRLESYYFYDTSPIIWGITARICREFALALKRYM